MTNFREHLLRTFSPDFRFSVPRGHSTCFTPRLRFELACGRTRRQRLRMAERRLVTLLETIFAAPGSFWLELTFWRVGDEPFDADGHARVIHLLEEAGLVAATAWSSESVCVDDSVPDEVTMEDRRAALVSTTSEAIETLAKIVVWYDFGHWKDVDCQLLFLDVENELLLHPYDDRGADLYAPDVDRLRNWHDRFNDWILDHDRPRIDKMFQASSDTS